MISETECEGKRYENTTTYNETVKKHSQIYRTYKYDNFLCYLLNNKFSNFPKFVLCPFRIASSSLAFVFESKTIRPLKKYGHLLTVQYCTIVM
jgi:hypothetical protein